jgi:methylglutaconyl-CoA hydratase
MTEALIARLGELAEEAAIRVLVMTGNGRSFCSGADLAWVREVIARGAIANRRDARRLALLMRRLNTFPRPTLARVNGPAYGGGIGLIACCDIAIASTLASFAFTEVRLGLVAAVIAPYIQAAIGARQTRRLLLSGEAIDGEAARALGLVHRVVAGRELDAAVEAQLQALLQGEAGAQAQTKRLLQRLSAGHAPAPNRSAELTARVRASPAGRRGIEAFLGRRQRSGAGETD